MRRFTVPSIPVAVFFDYASPRPVQLLWEVDGVLVDDVKVDVQLAQKIRVRPVAVWSDTRVTSIRSFHTRWLENIEDIGEVGTWDPDLGVEVEVTGPNPAEIPWPDMAGNVFHLFGYSEDGSLKFTTEIEPPSPLSLTVA
jgi:hypothetical protein